MRKHAMAEFGERVGVAVTNLNNSMMHTTTSLASQIHKGMTFFTLVTVLGALVLSITTLYQKPSNFASAWSIFVLVMAVLASAATLAHLVRPCDRR